MKPSMRSCPPGQLRPACGSPSRDQRVRAALHATSRRIAQVASCDYTKCRACRAQAGAFVHQDEGFLNGAFRLVADHSNRIAYARAVPRKLSVIHPPHDGTIPGRTPDPSLPFVTQSRGESGGLLVCS